MARRGVGKDRERMASTGSSNNSLPTYTEIDILNSSKYAEYNSRVRLLQKMQKRAPHLTSWLNVRVRDATKDDYYVPLALRASCKVLEIEMTKDLCDLLSCTPVRERDVCRPNEPATYYYVGDDGYDVQCQPACFNTALKATYNKDGGRGADTPQLNWHSGKCRIVNSSTVSWLEKTYYRSSTHYEFRLNDMPTGFSRVADNSNPFGCGFTYKPNPTYCRYYDRTMESNGECTMTTWEYVLDSVIGMSLINTVKSAIRMVSNNKVPFELPRNLPKLPSKLADVHTVEGWRENINRNFVIPPLIESKPQVPTGQRKKRDTTTSSEIDQLRQRAEMRSFATPNQLSSFLRQKMNISTLSTTADAEEEEKKKEEEAKKNWLEKIRDILVKLLESLATDDNFWIQMGIDLAISKAVEKLKTIAVKVFEKVAASLSKTALRLTGSLGTRVLAAGFKSLFFRSVGALVLRVGAQLAIMLAKLLTAVSSVVGWLLVGVMIFDIGFSLWDPFGYKNLFPANMPSDLMYNGETTLRQMFKSSEANYEFDQLANLLLSQDEVLEIQIESLFDRLIYLDALVVNSEGTLIEKGPLIDPAKGTGAQLVEAQTQANTERIRFDAQTYAAYNRRFNLRIELTNRASALSYTTIGISLILLFVARLTILGVLAFIIGLVLLCMTRALAGGGLDTVLALYDQTRAKWTTGKDPSDAAWGVAAE